MIRRRSRTETRPTADDTTRPGRLAARRRRHARVAAGVIVVAILGSGAAFAAGAMNDDSPSAEAAANEQSSLTFGQGTIANVAPLDDDEPRALDHEHPLRLWIGGDSLAGAFGPALGDLVGATGVATTTVDYKVSSGLWAIDARDWSERAVEQMESADPEAVVFMIGTNDTPVVNGVDANADDMPDWEVEYRAKVGDLMDVLVGDRHRPVLWLGPPTLGTRSLDQAAHELGELMKDEASKRAPDVIYVDTYQLFSTASGEYSRQIIDENGEEITARIGDGVHLSPDGASYLARALFVVLDARWKLTTQADPDNPIGWTFTDGSGENVPGYSSRPQSRYNNPVTPATDSPAPTYIVVPPTVAPPITSVVTAPPQTTPPTAPPTVPATSPPTLPQP